PGRALESSGGFHVPKQILSFTVNDSPAEVLVQPYVTLLDALREDLGLTGPKEGCGTGDCGACSVHLDGELVASCLVLALQARGRSVRTIEGLGKSNVLHPLLHAKLLRSPHAHARIVRINVSTARALPGVRAVLTAADIPELKRKAPTRAHAVLAIDRVVFAGQPVAAVAADEPAIAEEALDLIDVEYEVLPAAVDPLESMKPGAPPVAEAGTEADTSEAQAHGSVAGVKSEAKPAKAVNISQQARLQRGDVAKGLAESDVVIEKTY